MSYALVTGAAKGIGKAISEYLASKDYNLLLTDIDEHGLHETAENVRSTYAKDAQTFRLDLADAGSPEQLFSWSAPFHDQLTVVVNNAGYGLNGALHDRPLKQHLDLINVNIKALLSISYLFVPVLKPQVKGWLLNVGSTTAYQSIPYLSTYSSSKAFVVSFTRSLRYELKNTSVSVSCLSPGSTDTNFVNRAGMSDRTKKIAERYNMTPERVAKIAIDGLFNERSEILPGVTNQLHAFLVKFFRKAFIERTGAKIYGPENPEPKKDFILSQ